MEAGVCLLPTIVFLGFFSQLQLSHCRYVLTAHVTGRDKTTGVSGGVTSKTTEDVKNSKLRQDDESSTPGQLDHISIDTLPGDDNSKALGTFGEQPSEDEQNNSRHKPELAYDSHSSALKTGGDRLTGVKLFETPIHVTLTEKQRSPTNYDGVNVTEPNKQAGNFASKGTRNIKRLQSKNTTAHSKLHSAGKPTKHPRQNSVVSSPRPNVTVPQEPSVATGKSETSSVTFKTTILTAADNTKNGNQLPGTTGIHRRKLRRMGRKGVQSSTTERKHDRESGRSVRSPSKTSLTGSFPTISGPDEQTSEANHSWSQHRGDTVGDHNDSHIVVRRTRRFLANYDSNSDDGNGIGELIGDFLGLNHSPRDRRTAKPSEAFGMDEMKLMRQGLSSIAGETHHPRQKPGAGQPRISHTPRTDKNQTVAVSRKSGEDRFYKKRSATAEEALQSVLDDSKGMEKGSIGPIVRSEQEDTAPADMTDDLTMDFNFNPVGLGDNKREETIINSIITHNRVQKDELFMDAKIPKDFRVRRSPEDIDPDDDKSETILNLDSLLDGEHARQLEKEDLSDLVKTPKESDREEKKEDVDVGQFDFNDDIFKDGRDDEYNDTAASVMEDSNADDDDEDNDYEVEVENDNVWESIMEGMSTSSKDRDEPSSDNENKSKTSADSEAKSKTSADSEAKSKGGKKTSSNEEGSDKSEKNDKSDESEEGGGSGSKKLHLGIHMQKKKKNGGSDDHDTGDDNGDDGMDEEIGDDAFTAGEIPIAAQQEKDDNPNNPYPKIPGFQGDPTDRLSLGLGGVRIPPASRGEEFLKRKMENALDRANEK